MRKSCGVAILACTIAACGGRTASPAGSPAEDTAVPLTVEEYDALERRIGDAFATFERHVMAREGADAAEEATMLAVALGEVERFWAQHRRADAVKWAQDARSAATEAAGAATAGDFAKATRSTSSLERTCAQCHAAYREQAGGAYRIRPAALRSR
jgi:hypothetical protein